MQRRSLLLAGLAGAAVVSLPSLAGAAMLVQYQFGTTGQETTAETSPAYSASTTAAGVSATAVSDPANSIGLEISSAATTPTNAPFLRIDPQGNAADPNASVTGNKYFEFSILANALTDVDLSNLTLNVARGGGGTPRGFFIRTSADNFASTLAVTGTPALTANATASFGSDVNTARPAYTAVTADLSGASFQNIQNLPSSTLTFHVYTYSPAAGSSVDFDDITINGTAAAVPEPATAGVALVGMVGLLARRRRSA